MRRSLPFILYLAVLSLLSGVLMSEMSWIGRVGISLIHHEYRFLKVWYEGAAVIFVILLAFFVLQQMLQRRMPPATARVAHIIAIVLALLGLWATYHDFRSDFTHRILHERFHLGVFLFWFGWISISLFFLTERRRDEVKVPL